MSTPLITVQSSAFIYQAIARMDRHNIRHLGVVDGAGEIVGVLTSGNLIRQRTADAVILGEEMLDAGSTADLAAIYARLPHVAKSLLDEGVSARQIAAVLGEELCTLTCRAAQLAEAKMEATGKGAAPVPYCVAVLGSGGRRESLLVPDQDNALIYETGDDGGPEDAWFEEFTRSMNKCLDDVGVTYCKGDVMAQSQEWRHSVASWMRTIDGWLMRANFKDLCYVDNFYDFRVVHGDRAIASKVWHYAYSRAQESPGFLRDLAAVATDFRAPLGLFGGIRTSGGIIDVKRTGILPIVSGARVLALRHGIKAHSTLDRLNGVSALGYGNRDDIADMLAAHDILLREILDQQLTDIAQGRLENNTVNLKRLSKSRQENLRWALKKVDVMISLVGDPMAFG